MNRSADAITVRLKSILQRLIVGRSAADSAMLDAQLQLQLAREFDELRKNLARDNPAAHGFKVYSQSDEDGIIESICQRMNLGAGTFAEIGCGNGLENNTHYLLLKGWNGIWIDGDADNIAAINSHIPLLSDRLAVINTFIDRDNVAAILKHGLESLHQPQSIDLLSVDIDGNDLAVTLACIEAFNPPLVVVEYNAKFPYPAALSVTYDKHHQWNNDDYHGASLGAWVKALGGRYRLTCCNLAGTNAFFVRADHAAAFVAQDPARLYQPARFYLTVLRSGHKASMSFLARQLAGKLN